VDAILTDGLYFPFQITFTSMGGTPPPCPDPPIVHPTEPTVVVEGDIEPIVIIESDVC
jgi:hypothetical protein